MTATGGDVAELLDVDVDHCAGMRVLVAAHRLAGHPVQIGQPADPAADQDGVDGGGGQADPWRDLRWSQPLLAAQVDHLADHRRGRAAGRVVGAAGPVSHPGHALILVALCPPTGGWAADLEPFGGTGDRPALLHDAAGQSEPAELTQRCVTVRHEDLLGSAWVLGSSTPDPEGLPKINSAQDDSPCTNLSGQYS